MAAPRDHVLVLQLTDTHLHAAADSRMRGVTTFQTLLDVLAAVQQNPQWPPDAIVVTGDIVQDESQAGYERFRDALGALGVPVCCVPGNHDDPLLMRKVLAEPPFSVSSEFELAGWTLVLLDTFAAGDDGGRLGKRGLEALARSLARHDARHVLIFMHHHPLAMGSAWLDGVALRDADAFLATIDHCSQLRGVVWGHVHQASDRTRDGVRFLSTPSTCAQFLPHSAHFALDDLPPAARWLRLGADGNIDTEIQWVSPAT